MISFNQVPNNLRGALLVFIAMCFVACGPRVPDPGSAVVVRFGDAVLDQQGLSYYLPDSISADDSIRLAQQAIERWLRAQAIKAEAIRIMPELEDELEPAVAHYEQTLIAQAYEQWLSTQNEGQFEVSETDIQNYYTKNPDKFISREPYYQFFYIETPLSNQYKVVTLMNSRDPESREELITWAKENASEFKLDSSYVDEEEIDRLSEGFYFGNIRNASRNTSYPYQHKEGDSTFYDFFRLLDVIKPDELMPLSLVRDRIIAIIRNQRRQTLVEQSRASLIQQAKAAGKVNYPSSK
ncbi:MAG: hypothetical protein AAFV07_05670 [Bacteroidota bacterium]